MFNDIEKKKLLDGEYVDIGNKRYAYCQDCRQIIQVNKTVFGSLHICGDHTNPYSSFSDYNQEYDM